MRVYRIRALGNKGGILGFVMIIMLTLTLLGYGVINLSGVDAVEVVKTMQSSQAFWIAEAGIQKAIVKLPNTDPLAGNLGAGMYNVTVQKVPGYNYRWTIDSIGTVQNKTRRIQVVIGPMGGPGADGIVNVQGPIDMEHGTPNINGEVNEYAAIFSFEDPFKYVLGKTKDEVYAMAIDPNEPPVTVYTDPPNNVTPVSGITWITVSPGTKLLISDNNWTGSGLLVVIGDLKLTGGTFNGIIWVTGSLEMASGNVYVNGSIFVECGIDIETVIHGTPTLTYDPSAIDDVFTDIWGGGGGGGSYTLHILSWQEIS